MRVLVCGATGFIGSRLIRRLADAGHVVIAVTRKAGHTTSHARVQWIAGDLSRDLTAAAWTPRLAGVDAVVNAAGILREQRDQRFSLLHADGPRALFDACVQAGVSHVVQVSALGADEMAVSRYHRSKREADDHLLSLPISGTVVQPSLVFGPGGASTTLFTQWASLPVLPLPGDGRQAVQPVYVDDLIDALQRLIEQPGSGPRRLAVVGPRPITLRVYLGELRHGLRLPPARFVPVPHTLVDTVVSGAGRLPGALADREILAMLERGNTAPVDDLQALLGRTPRPVEEFISPETADTARTAARLGWTLPLLRLAIACVWIVTGVISLGLYPVEDSYVLLARVGLSGPLATVALYGAAVLDLGLGISTLVLRRRRLLWLLQIGLILGYTAVITWALPEFWLHPFGPILKNLPMLAALGLLLALEKPRWNT